VRRTDKLILGHDVANQLRASLLKMVRVAGLLRILGQQGTIKGGLKTKSVLAILTDQSHKSLWRVRFGPELTKPWRPLARQFRCAIMESKASDETVPRTVQIVSKLNTMRLSYLALVMAATKGGGSFLLAQAEKLRRALCAHDNASHKTVLNHAPVKRLKSRPSFMPQWDEFFPMTRMINYCSARQPSAKGWVAAFGATFLLCRAAPFDAMAGGDVVPQNTNEVPRVMFDSLYFRQPERSSDVGRTFVSQSQDRFEQLVTRRWMSLFVHSSTFESVSPERIESIGKNALTKSVIQSGREILLETSLALNIRDYLDDTLQGAGQFIMTSLGSVDEEEIETVSLDFQGTGYSWWNELRRGNRIRYGIRPFRTSPYAFMGLRLNDGADGELLFANLRYYFYRFESHRVEALFTVPLVDKWNFNTGVAYSNADQDIEDGRELAWTLRLERPLWEVNPYGSFFVSADVGQESRILFGLSAFW